MTILQSIAHGATVHLPLGLAVLLPFQYLATAIAVRMNWFPNKIWLVLWGFFLIQVISSILALLTGQRSMVLSAAAPELIKRHNDLAWQFVGVWIAAFLILTIFAWLKWSRVVWLFHVILAALMIVQFVTAIQLGSVGGAMLAS